MKPNRSLAFYRTHQGAELDLLIQKAGIPTVGVEIKFGDNVRVSKGNIEAASDIKDIRRIVITQNSRRFSTKEGFEVMNLNAFIKEELPNI